MVSSLQLSCAIMALWMPPKLEGVRVVIYEPTAYTRALIREYLTRMRVRDLIEAEDCVDLRQTVLSMTFDVLIANWTYHASDRQSVPEFLMQLRGEGDFEFSLMAISGDARRSVFLQSEHVGAGMVLLKPFSFRSFCDRFCWLLDRKISKIAA